MSTQPTEQERVAALQAEAATYQATRSQQAPTGNLTRGQGNGH